jgi:hypothetical protein
MSQPLLEDVFKRSGLPTYTFVEPAEYNHLRIALRTPGRGVVIEGPSGIGKTTAVRKAATDVGISDRAQMLSGRNLSFAGEERAIAQRMRDVLQEHQIEVFYDKDEQHLILAEDIEAYLAPIYRSEARFVVALLSKNFPRKIWTKFESEQFKSRFGEKSVIPIWFSDAPPGMFDETTRVGGLTVDPGGDLDSQIASICGELIKKVGAERREEDSVSRQREQAQDLVEE